MTLYEQSESQIWTDPYISRQLLLAHLNINTDAASRRPETIAKTVNWILSGGQDFASVVDFGCGPGLYTEAFDKANLKVTGVDINQASLKHARQSAAMNGLDIKYLEGNYLELELGSQFDLLTCIYCDFGALTALQQDRFLKNAHRHLKTGGMLVLDVFGKGISDVRTEGKTWTEEGKNGFWGKRHHYVLSETTHFQEQRVWGTKHIVIEDRQKSKEFILWDHYYTREEITVRIEEFGFRIMEIEEDLVEANDFATSDVLFVRARKT